MVEKIPFHKKNSYHWFVVGTVCIGAFMAALDASIINVAMPTLSSVFSVGMDTVEWVTIAYLLTLTSLLTLLGSLSDRLGRKFFYTLGFAIFGIGSALCGLSMTMAFLITARVLQALGATMLQANSIAIITSAVPTTSRGKAIGIQGSAQAIGLSIGPSVGGLLIANFGWRLIFYVNIPVAIVGTLLASYILPKDKPNPLSTRFDYLGAVLFTPPLILLVLIFKNGYKVGWASPEIIMEFIGVIIFMLLFVWREKKYKNPMINLDLLKISVFTSGNITGLLSYALMFGTIFLMPFYLDWILKLPALFIGLILTVVSL
ncbi:MAG: MFS transporter, partial [Desulfosporosinus sp.]|nr:MFS transporter [Desulfosporosinus sp.]